VTRLQFAAAAGAMLLASATAGADSMALSFKAAIYQDDAEMPLKDPEGVACGEGVVVVSDTGNARLLRYRLRDGLPVGATVVKLEQLKQPTAVQTDAKGNLWVLDRRARKIGRVDPQGSFGGWLEIKGVDATPAVEPVAFKLLESGIVLLDASVRRVLVVDASGALIRQVPLPKGEFTDVAADASGVLYAVDAVGSIIWSVEKGGTAFKPLTKSLKDVLTFPASLVATDKGVLLLCDKHGHGVVFVGTDGSFMGRQLDMGPKEGVLYYPTALCVTGAGDMFVADRGNNRVQVFRTQR
jgi:hypothetical protein